MLSWSVGYVFVPLIPCITRTYAQLHCGSAAGGGNSTFPNPIPNSMSANATADCMAHSYCAGDNSAYASLVTFSNAAWALVGGLFINETLILACHSFRWVCLRSLAQTLRELALVAVSSRLFTTSAGWKRRRSRPRWHDWRWM